MPVYTVDGVIHYCVGNMRLGLNVYQGKITYQAVAEAFGMMADYVPVEEMLAQL